MFKCPDCGKDQFILRYSEITDSWIGQIETVNGPCNFMFQLDLVGMTIVTLSCCNCKFKLEDTNSCDLFSQVRKIQNGTNRSNGNRDVG